MTAEKEQPTQELVEKKQIENEPISDAERGEMKEMISCFPPHEGNLIYSEHAKSFKKNFPDHVAELNLDQTWNGMKKALNDFRTKAPDAKALAKQTCFMLDLVPEKIKELDLREADFDGIIREIMITLSKTDQRELPEQCYFASKLFQKMGKFDRAKKLDTFIHPVEISEIAIHEMDNAYEEKNWGAYSVNALSLKHFFPDFFRQIVTPKIKAEMHTYLDELRTEKEWWGYNLLAARLKELES